MSDNPMVKAIRALMGTAISSSRLDEGQLIVDRKKFEEMVATYRREHFGDETDEEYTPTTSEVVRGYRLPGWVVDPQQPNETFSEYIGRISVEGHAVQVASERAAGRWLTRLKAEVRKADFAECSQIARSYDTGYDTTAATIAEAISEGVF